MFQSIKKTLGLLALLGGVAQANAFSLMGPFETWQVFEIGYQLPSDLGGPMNLGEEYRWNAPTIVYGYDSSFLDYFGQRGVEAVEQAIAILNAVPAVSTLSTDLTEFPLDTRRFNFRATALGLIDLKSEALSLVLGQLGLTSPERFVWTLRARVVIANIPNYTTVKRNFDPVTLVPSSYVNGTLYTYQILQTYANPNAWENVEIAVDPLAPSVTSVASLGGIRGGTPDFRGLATLFSYGLFFTGLTRDDVGGLRYIYSRSNVNVENLATNATASGFGGVISVGGGGGGSPWTPVPTPTNAATGGGTGVPGGTPNPVPAANTGVITALRPGVEKLTFVRADFNSVLGAFFTNSVAYADTFITNSTIRSQNVVKSSTLPDIIFSASDLPLAGGLTPPTTASTTAAGWANNSTLSSAGTRVGLAGPGVIQGPVQITFNKTGPHLFNTPEGTEEVGLPGFIWGSFDGSTNAPVVYPVGSSIEDLERLIGVRNVSSAKNSARVPVR